MYEHAYMWKYTYACMYVSKAFRNFSKLKFITSIALLYYNAKKQIVLQDNIRINFVYDYYRE